MSGESCTTLHDVAPEAALAALCCHNGPVLLDLDETLYFRNSTEDFIDSARPGTLALLLLRFLDLLTPWRWTGGEVTRDVWRVRLITAFFPWINGRWRDRVGHLAATYGNEQLVSALKQRTTPPIIATVGFLPIVAPLIAALGFPDVTIVAARLSTFQDRRGGKLSLVMNALGEDTIRNGMVITDSTQDLPLLDACAHPLRIVWPRAHYKRALSGVYLPGQYLTQIKRPGERYIVRGILQEDFAYCVLSTIALAPLPVLHIIGLLFLLVSFWAIYECGYVDNDRIASRFESEPKLTAQFADVNVATPRFEPWLWAFTAGVLAIVLLRWPQTATPLDFAKWAAVLIVTHLWFRLYNRLDKSTRVWMYFGLQLARSAAFMVLLPVSLIAAVTIAAHILAGWIPYYVYRFGGTDWPNVPLCLTRLMFLVILSLVLAMSLGLSPFMNYSALGVIGWTVFRARQDLKVVLLGARRLDRPAPSPPP